MTGIRHVQYGRSYDQKMGSGNQVDGSLQILAWNLSGCSATMSSVCVPIDPVDPSSENFLGPARGDGGGPFPAKADGEGRRRMDRAQAWRAARTIHAELGVVLGDVAPAGPRRRNLGGAGSHRALGRPRPRQTQPRQRAARGTAESGVEGRGPAAQTRRE